MHVSIVCVRVCMRVCMRVYMRVCVRMLCVCMRTRAHVCGSERACARVRVCEGVSVRACLYMCVYTCAYEKQTFNRYEAALYQWERLEREETLRE
eukprot:m.70365 g.70365  ORF g.70365 m.70365 type:complete len:95 (+) comp24215_c0_seq1:121-405(+)